MTALHLYRCNPHSKHNAYTCQCHLSASLNCHCEVNSAYVLYPLVILWHETAQLRVEVGGMQTALREGEGLLGVVVGGSHVLQLLHTPRGQGRKQGWGRNEIMTNYWTTTSYSRFRDSNPVHTHCTPQSHNNGIGRQSLTCHVTLKFVWCSVI